MKQTDATRLTANDDRAWAFQQMAASPETARRLDVYIGMLDRWRAVTNLISASTWPEVWRRHVADCAQILPLAPSARRWLDFGSGAGFPSVVIAIQLAETRDAEVHCVESDRRKCAFLREVARATGAPLKVHAARIEAFQCQTVFPIEAVTARALAPLPELLGFFDACLEQGAVGVFPRGRSEQREIDALTAREQFQIETFPSKTDPLASLVRVRRAAETKL